MEPIPDREDRFKIRTFCFLEFASHEEAAVVFNRHQITPQQQQQQLQLQQQEQDLQQQQAVPAVTLPPSPPPPTDYRQHLSCLTATDEGGGGGACRAPVAGDAVGVAAYGERGSRNNSNSSGTTCASEDDPLGACKGGVAGGCGACSSSCTATTTASTLSPVDSTAADINGGGSGGGGGGCTAPRGGGGPIGFEKAEEPERCRRGMKLDPRGAQGGSIFNLMSVGNSSRGTVSPSLDWSGGGTVRGEGFSPSTEGADSALQSAVALAKAAEAVVAAARVGDGEEGVGTAGGGGSDGTAEGGGVGVGDGSDEVEGERFPLVVGGAVLKVDWADPLRYHIHLNGGIKGPSAPPELGMGTLPDGRLVSSRVGAGSASRGPAPAGMWVACAPRQGGGEAGWQHPGPQQGSLVRHLSSDPRLPSQEGERARFARVGHQQQQHIQQPQQHIQQQQQQQRQYHHQQQGAESMPPSHRPSLTPHRYGGASPSTLLPRRERGYTVSDSRSASACSSMGSAVAAAAPPWKSSFDGGDIPRGTGPVDPHHHHHQDFGGGVRASPSSGVLPPPRHYQRHSAGVSRGVSFSGTGGGGGGGIGRHRDSGDHGTGVDAHTHVRHVDRLARSSSSSASASFPETLEQQQQQHRNNNHQHGVARQQRQQFHDIGSSGSSSASGNITQGAFRGGGGHHDRGLVPASGPPYSASPEPGGSRELEKYFSGSVSAGGSVNGSAGGGGSGHYLPALSRSVTSRREGGGESSTTTRGGGCAGVTGSSPWDGNPGTPSLWPRRATEDGGVGALKMAGRLGGDTLAMDVSRMDPGPSLKLEGRRASCDAAGAVEGGVSFSARRLQQEWDQQQLQQRERQRMRQWDQGWTKEEGMQQHHPRRLVEPPGIVMAQPKVRVILLVV